MTSAALADLIERLEAADEGSAELDAEICAATRVIALCSASWLRHWGGPFAPMTSDRTRVAAIHDDGKEGVNWKPLQFTTSLNSAMYLVPDGYGVHLESNTAHIKACASDGTCGGHLHWALVSRDGYGDHHGGPTLALALCIAALKARAALTDNQQP